MEFRSQKSAGELPVATTPTKSPIRSFVRREGRVTPAQQRALEELWPLYGVDFASARLDLAAVFGRAAPLTLEIGFGNGETLASLAAAHPARNYLGIEVHRPGVGRLLNAIAARGLDNVRVIVHDAVEAIEAMLPDAAVDQALIYFPDPWPKKRHHKRRLVQAPFAAMLARVLAPGARLELATDWEDYAATMLETLDAAPAFINLAGRRRFSERPPYRPSTRFERRGLGLGHAVRDLVYERVRNY